MWQIAIQVAELINEAAAKGLMLPRTANSIYEALLCGDGFAIVIYNTVMAYTECRYVDGYHIICGVISRGGGNNGQPGTAIVTNRMKECWRRNSDNDVILACAPKLVRFYERFGFVVKPKAEAPECVRGARSEADWMACEKRVWMMCTKSSYDKEKEIGSMAKPNAFVKVSGNLLENALVIGLIREVAKAYSVVVCVGGSEQINKAFEEGEFQIKFGSLGITTHTLAERQLARDVLERNEALTQDWLDDNGISARAIILVQDIGGVLCHINEDVMLLAAYNGFNKLYIITEKSRVDSKKLWLKKLAEAFETTGEGELDKIEVIGF
jgi:hypothetical protein